MNVVVAITHSGL